jgi:hypothetical protein
MKPYEPRLWEYGSKYPAVLHRSLTYSRNLLQTGGEVSVASKIANPTSLFL